MRRRIELGELLDWKQSVKTGMGSQILHFASMISSPSISVSAFVMIQEEVIPNLYLGLAPFYGRHQVGRELSGDIADVLREDLPDLCNTLTGDKVRSILSYRIDKIAPPDEPKTQSAFYFSDRFYSKELLHKVALIPRRSRSTSKDSDKVSLDDEFIMLHKLFHHPLPTREPKLVGS